jgi:hypothetical protein
VVADETKGYEADKMILLLILTATNLTEGWDGTVDSFLWSKDGKKVYFTAAVDGTKQLLK